MEKKDLKDVSDNVKQKLSEVKEKVKLPKEEGENNVIEPLVTCRMLFISVLDKIILFFIALSFITVTSGLLFSGKLSSIEYSYWHSFTSELALILTTTIIYFFMNWLYKCALKTMLCVTKNEVYKVTYAPFVKRETTIPLNKITGVSSHRVLWIFRCVVVHQYMQIPKVFFTWNAQEFKDKVVELTTNDKGKIANAAEDKNLIQSGHGKYILYILAVVGVAFVLLGIARFFAYTFRPGKSVVGKYHSDNYSLVLKRGNTCEIKLDDNKEYSNCTYEYEESNHMVFVKYHEKGSKYSYITEEYITEENDKNFSLTYNIEDKSLHGSYYNFSKDNK